jgi:hypothetical protein
MFDPIAEKRAMQYSKKELDAIFKDKGSGKVAMKLMTENPALYKVMRKEYEAQGGIGVSAYGTPAPYTTGKPQKSYTDRELFLRAKYSLAELTTFFQSNKSNNPGSKEETPSSLFRSGETFELDPRICKELSLPEGFRVNQEGYYRAIQAVKNAAASKAVAAEKAEQARQDQEAAANNPDNEVK